ncbi:hypothetical protein HGRIS_010198 [Hohenbuehelia grisea]|uniref:Uncharacterized protein n=1 Tax=Hohenbuehelia grisea TaxID=104357 RepID=A0ABR3J3I4_9AGAR
MVTIWGFNLSEMRVSAFKGKNMYDRRWYLRRERLIAYQLAMNICLAAECTATYSLSKYEAQQENIERYSNWQASVHNNDIIAAEVLTIVFCVFVATIFGADLFFLVLWPARKYPRWYHVIRNILAIGVTLGIFAAALMSTIVVASHASYITGVSSELARQYQDIYHRPPLNYKSWAVNIAYVVVLWIGWLFTIASTTFMFIASNHDQTYGPEPESEKQSVRRDDTGSA